MVCFCWHIFGLSLEQVNDIPMLVKCYISQHWQDINNIPILVKRDPTWVKEDNMPILIKRKPTLVKKYTNIGIDETNVGKRKIIYQ